MSTELVRPLFIADDNEQAIERFHRLNTMECANKGGKAFRLFFAAIAATSRCAFLVPSRI